MMRVALLVALGMAAACGGTDPSNSAAGERAALSAADTNGPPRSERGRGIFSDRSESPAPLVPHIVAPQTTDPAIDQALDNHYAWLDTSAETNHKLLVFMPGHGARPAVYQLVQKEAALLGYHVIGLMYVNGGPRLAIACGIAADPNACWEDTHLENLDGIHRNRSVVNVNVPNSIYNRLRKLLAYLAAHYPQEGWSRFLAHGEPKWSRIAVGGHSQGGAQAAMIAKSHAVARVVLFSSPPDAVHTEAPLWVATHVTPTARYWGLVHDRDPGFRSIRGSWDLIGMGAFGAAVAPEASEPPYGFTHMLVTDVVPQGGSFSAGAHSAPVGDDFTPLSADGKPLLRDAWRYMLGAQDGDDDEAEDESDQQGCVFGPWSAPVNMGPTINGSFNESHPWITRDGLSLYITTTRFSQIASDEDIAVSQRSSRSAPWSAPVRLGPNVNTVGFNDAVPSISEDGLDMYFHSPRPGGCGAADIYVSHRDDPTDDFAWQPAVNLGCVVNNSGPDNGPDFFRAHGIDYLYFLQNNTPGHIGAATNPNIVLSTRPRGSGIAGWSSPVVVAELNSIYRQGRVTIRRADGLETCFSRDSDPAGFGGTDIYCSSRTSLSSPWSAPVNLGPAINTPFNDGGSAFDFKGQTLYFFSDRPGGFGLRDLYTATRRRFCTQ